ncbi:MAG: hypothetical protein RL521_524 [Bacteroidota bacterium]
MSIIFVGMRDLTPQFWVCRSSAGSGKTYNLVKQYLRLCLREDQPDRYARILAITFTNNAAAEMKKRILDRLHDFSHGSKLKSTDGAYGLFHEIAAELKIDPLALEERAQKTLTHILHHYHRFAVSTIDAFIHRIVRSFARDLWMHPDFEIEMDVDRVLEEVVDRCLDQTGKVTAITGYLKKLVQFQMEEGKSWNPKTVMLEFARTMYTEKGMEALARQEGLGLDDFSKVFDTLIKWRAQLAKKPMDLAKNALTLLDACSTDIKEHHYYSGQPYNKLKALSEMVLVNDKENPFMAEDLSSRWTGAMESSWTKIKGKSAIKDAFEQNTDAINQQVLSLWEWYRSDEIKTYYLVDKWIANFYALGLVHYLHDVAEELKLERNFLMIQDFHQVISKVIIDNPTPFIYEKVGERFDDLLFDEFQDTSQLQWKNFLPLVHQSLSKGGEVFVVGDGKQSIYRWRNGDVKQFVQLPTVPMNDGLLGLETLVKTSYRPMHLAANFRSFKNVVLFNNHVFEILRGEMTPMMQAVYEGQEQLDKNQHPGSVHYHVFQQEEKTRELMIANLVAVVQDCQQKGFSLSDIAILTRKGKSDASPIAQALKAAQIAINTQDSFLLAQSPKVRLLMAYLIYLAQPKELYYRFDLIRSIAEVFPAEFSRHEALLACMVERTRKDGSKRFELSEIADVLLQWRTDLPMRWMSGSSAYDIARAAISIMGIEVDEYVEYLLDQLSQKSQHWGYYPSELVRWWDKAKCKLCINSQVSAEAVQIMTVHRSKGLEFPVVIYPRFGTKKPHQQIWVPVNEDSIPIKDAMLRFSGGAPKYYHPDAFSEEFEESVLDDLNLMYVAQTRAVQRLYILQEDKGGASEKPKEELSWETLITHLMIRLMQEKGIEKSDKQWMFGEDHVATLEKREEKEVLIESLATAEKSRAIRIRYSATKRQLGEKFSGARKKGELYHAYLQGLILGKDGPELLRYLESRGFQWTTDEMMALDHLKAKMQDQGQLVQWQSLKGRWFIEQSMLMEQSNELRPDAFCVEADGITLIDFKTGKKKTEHQQQVANYLRVLTDIWNRPVKGYLYYTEDLTCIEI